MTYSSSSGSGITSYSGSGPSSAGFGEAGGEVVRRVGSVVVCGVEGEVVRRVDSGVGRVVVLLVVLVLDKKGFGGGGRRFACF